MTVDPKHYTYHSLETDTEFRSRLREKWALPFGCYEKELDDWAWEAHKLQRKIVMRQS